MLEPNFEEADGLGICENILSNYIATSCACVLKKGTRKFQEPLNAMNNHDWEFPKISNTMPYKSLLVSKALSDTKREIATKKLAERITKTVTDAFA